MASKTTKVFLDRIEGGMGVLVSGVTEGLSLDVPRDFLPDGAREGTAFTLTLAEDESATAAGKQEVASLMDELLKRGA
jgi:hypothetical protein